MTLLQRHNLFARHRFAFACFGVLLVYEFVFVARCRLEIIDNVTVMYHLIDFSFGFCTKILPGALCNLLLPEVNAHTVLIYDIVLLCLFFFALSFLLEQLAKTAPSDCKTALFLLLALFLAGPCAFSGFVVNPGILDVYWIFLSAGVVFFLSRKQLYPLLVPLFFCGLLIHFSFVISYFPFWGLLLIYRWLMSADKKERQALTAVTAACFLVTVGWGVYFLLFERSNLTYTLEEFHNIMVSKGIKYPEHFEYVFYRRISYDADGVVHTSPYHQTNDFFSSFWNMTVQQVLTNIDLVKNNPSELWRYAQALLLTFPVVFCVFRFFIAMARQAKPKWRRYFFCACLLRFFGTLFVGLLFSTDFIRWLTHASLPLFATALYILWFEKAPAWRIAKQSFSCLSDLQWSVFFIPYSLCALNPYS